MADRVVVFLDWQNVYKGARESFHVPSSPSVCGQVDPLALASRIVRHVPNGVLKQVRIYRGIPSNASDPVGYAATRKQTAAWMKNQLPAKVYVYHRPLQYLPGMDPREKGIDVQLAIDFVVMATKGEYDVGVLFSTDTDLAPALDAVYELNGVQRPWPWTAGWDGPNHQKRCVSASGRRRTPCCWIGAGDYHAIRDSVRYAGK